MDGKQGPCPRACVVLKGQKYNSVPIIRRGNDDVCYHCEAVVTQQNQQHAPRHESSYFQPNAQSSYSQPNTQSSYSQPNTQFQQGKPQSFYSQQGNNTPSFYSQQGNTVSPYFQQGNTQSSYSQPNTQSSYSQPNAQSSHSQRSFYSQQGNTQSSYFQQGNTKSSYSQQPNTQSSYSQPNTQSSYSQQPNAPSSYSQQGHTPSSSYQQYYHPQQSLAGTHNDILPFNYYGLCNKCMLSHIKWGQFDVQDDAAFVGITPRPYCSACNIDLDSEPIPNSPNRLLSGVPSSNPCPSCRKTTQVVFNFVCGSCKSPPCVLLKFVVPNQKDAPCSRCTSVTRPYLVVRWPCDHVTCMECFKHLCKQVENFQVKCPAGCGSIIDDPKMFQLLGPRDYQQRNLRCITYIQPFDNEIFNFSEGDATGHTCYMRIFWVESKKTITVLCHAGRTIFGLKKAIERQEYISAASQHLINGSTELDNAKTILAYNLSDSTQLWLSTMSADTALHFSVGGEQQGKDKKKGEDSLQPYVQQTNNFILFLWPSFPHRQYSFSMIRGNTLQVHVTENVQNMAQALDDGPVQGILQREWTTETSLTYYDIDFDVPQQHIECESMNCIGFKFKRKK